MKITVIGTGYVGLVSGTCFAETGNDVMCIDINEEKIQQLQQGKIPIYEIGLKELVDRNIEEGRLCFSTNLKEGIEFGEIIISAVGTPSGKDHKADLSFVESVARDVGKYINEYKVFVNKSTVPVGTGEKCKEIIRKELMRRGKFILYDVVSNPEFLREGAAVRDTMNPERIVIGVENEQAKEYMERLYAPFIRTNTPLVCTNIKSAEIIKYASNAFLASKISFINEIAQFCSLTGADVTEVAKGMGLDSRIGSRFLHAGIGYGGSCFPKDVQALIQTGREQGYEFRMLDAVERVNNHQKKYVFTRLKEILPNIEGKTIGVLGLSFKPKTDDMRDAPSIKIIKKIQAEGAHIQAFDPVAMKNATQYLSETNLEYVKNPYEAAKNANVLIILTEWDEFRNMDLERIKKVMKGKTIIDGRNMFSLKEIKSHGFEYHSVGRSTIIPPEKRKEKTASYIEELFTLSFQVKEEKKKERKEAVAH